MLSVRDAPVCVMRSVLGAPAFLQLKLMPAKCTAYAVIISRQRLYSSAGDLSASRRSGTLKKRSSTVICVPCVPAVGRGSALSPGLLGTSLPSP
jgi:hypothetical protein